MNMNDIITRINELYRKSKSVGLTGAERAEQTQLRRKYLNAIKHSLRDQLDHIEIVDDHQPKH